MQLLNKSYQLLIKGILYDPYILCVFLFSYVRGTTNTTVREINHNQIIQAIIAGKSIIRLGDGEVLNLTGRDIYFQTATKKIQASLYQLITEYGEDSKYVLGVPVKKLTATEQDLPARELKIWRLYRTYFPKRFNKKQSYISLTWFYKQGIFHTHVRPLLQHKHVIFISNVNVLDEHLRDYAQEHFSASSFIEAPSKNADAQSESIISTINEKLASSTLPCVIVFAAGPALKSIAADFILKKQNPVQFLDVGHGLSLVAHPERDRSYKA